MSAAQTTEQAIAIRQESFSSTCLMPHNMDEAIQLANLMSSARMVPKHLQGDIGTCLMVIEQALRWRMSPFAVAQGTSNISGKMMFEGKLVAAAVECSGAIEGGFDYQFTGSGENRTVTVSARRRGEHNHRTIAIRLGDVKTGNEWWKKQPDQQLVYSGARNWARRWTPSVILGVYSPEEFGRNIDVDVRTIEGHSEGQPVITTQPSQFEVTALDDIGEPILIDDKPLVFTTPIRFAQWLYTTAETSQSLIGLLEHNADAIDDAKQFPEAKEIIDSIKTPDVTLQHPESRVLDTDMDEATTLAKRFGEANDEASLKATTQSVVTRNWLERMRKERKDIADMLDSIYRGRLTTFRAPT